MTKKKENILIKKLVLGSAQFGSKYGIFNSSDFVDNDEVKKIISLFSCAGCNFIDTATDYPNSEKILGKSNVKDFKIITKIPIKEVNLKFNGRYFIKKSIRISLNKLKIKKLYGLLFRSPLKLLSENFKEYWNTAKEMQSLGQIEKLGVSIYDPDELSIILDRLKPDIVQAPFNIIDQRIKNKGWLDLLHKKNIEVHARSIFFQGILLKRKNLLIDKNTACYKLWNNYHKWLMEQKMNSLDACLNFVLKEKKISKIILGVDNLKQMQEILNVKKKKIKNIKIINDNNSNLFNINYWKENIKTE